MLRHVQLDLPQENLLYVADQAHVPYGSRSASEIRRLSEAIVRFLLSQEAKLIVVACNTASGAALTYLREVFPKVPFVGMEPAVKPAARLTKNGRVGVLATTTTFESQRYVNLMNRFAEGVEVLQDPCPGLVDQIEAGEVDSPATKQMLRRFLRPMQTAGVDTIVLGCTHYPFVVPLIENIVGPGVTIIDPAPAVARQTGRILRLHGLEAPAGLIGYVNAFTTGNLQEFSASCQRLLNQHILVKAAVWRGDNLIAA